MKSKNKRVFEMLSLDVFDERDETLLEDSGHSVHQSFSGGFSPPATPFRRGTSFSLLKKRIDVAAAGNRMFVSTGNDNFRRRKCHSRRRRWVVVVDAQALSELRSSDASSGWSWS
jgi:hypothetical protein